MRSRKSGRNVGVSCQTNETPHSRRGAHLRLSAKKKRVVVDDGEIGLTEI